MPQVLTLEAFFCRLFALIFFKLVKPNKFTFNRVALNSFNNNLTSIMKKH